MATDASLKAATKRYVPDDEAVFDGTDRRGAAVTAALEKFSTDLAHARLAGIKTPYFPRVVAASVTANPVLASTLTGWEPRYSTVLEVEWPYLTATQGILSKSLQVGADGKPAVTYDIETDGTEKLRFPGVPVSSGAPAVVRFAAKWTAATLPAAYEEPMVLLASSYYARGLVGVYENAVSPEPQGFSIVETGQKADHYKSLADYLFGLYEQALGLEPRNPITLRRAEGEPVAGGA